MEAEQEEGAPGLGSLLGSALMVVVLGMVVAMLGMWGYLILFAGVAGAQFVVFLHSRDGRYEGGRKPLERVAWHRAGRGGMMEAERDNFWATVGYAALCGFFIGGLIMAGPIVGLAAVGAFSLVWFGGVWVLGFVSPAATDGEEDS